MFFKKLLRKIGLFRPARKDAHFMGVASTAAPEVKKTTDWSIPAERLAKAEIHRRAGDFCNTCQKPIAECPVLKNLK